MLSLQCYTCSAFETAEIEARLYYGRKLSQSNIKTSTATVHRIIFKGVAAHACISVTQFTTTQQQNVNTVVDNNECIGSVYVYSYMANTGVNLLRILGLIGAQILP